MQDSRLHTVHMYSLISLIVFEISVSCRDLDDFPIHGPPVLISTYHMGFQLQIMAITGVVKPKRTAALMAAHLISYYILTGMHAESFLIT